MRFMGAGEPRRWRVGQVATATGVTVRRLNHYDEIGRRHPFMWPLPKAASRMEPGAFM